MRESRLRESAEAANRAKDEFLAIVRAEDRAKAKAAGFDDHVAKPVDPDELVLRIAALVRRSNP